MSKITTFEKVFCKSDGLPNMIADPISGVACFLVTEEHARQIVEMFDAAEANLTQSEEKLRISNERRKRLEAKLDEAEACCAERLRVLKLFDWEDAIPSAFPGMVIWEESLSSTCGKDLLKEFNTALELLRQARDHHAAERTDTNWKWWEQSASLLAKHGIAVNPKNA